MMEGIEKSFGDRNILDNITFGIDEGEKIGLLGINGTGKTTLLKIIAGTESIDKGNIIKKSDLRLEFMSQNPDFDDEATILEQVFKGNSPLMKVLRDYEETMNKVNNNPSDTKLQQKLLSLSQKMDDLKAWQIESEAKTVLTKLGVTDFEKKVGILSGGQRKRIALASALISPCDLLILDEPTNHLDNQTIDWLEEYLKGYKGALIMVTHDRYFLDRVINNIVEIDKGKVYKYTGNYSYFLEKKVERQQSAESSELKRQNIFRNELAWIKRGVRARGTKQKARIDRFEDLKDSKLDLHKDKLEIKAVASRLGKKVIELENISKKFNDQNVIDDFSYIFTGDSRVGIIGPNGIGKSTLLNIIAERITADSGILEIGQTVKLGCFFQENYEIKEDLRVIEYIKEVAEFLPDGEGNLISASQMLEKFLFPPEKQWTSIARLSGGEKRRLYLLRVLMQAPNVLLLDEPTNDLDIETLTILENYLDEFPGVVIAVSHDRYFLDKVAENIFAYQEGGIIKTFVGNYSEYLEYKSINEISEEKIIIKEKKDPLLKTKEPVLKLTYKEQKEFEQIEDIITQMEEELEKVSEEINIAGSNYVLLEELTNKQQELEKELEEKMDRWAYLTQLAEEIEENKKNKQKC